jgi:hypothetical protein
MSQVAPGSKAWLAATVLLLGLLGVVGGARAETRRLAILVGNNVGAGARPPLRFAEEDVNRLAGVLAELGGFERPDLWTVKGGSIAGVRHALLEIRQRLKAWRRRPDQRAVVLFYFSGHSDGLSLELGSGRLPFIEVRRLLGETAADVRLAIVDSCRAGGLLAVKGGTPGPAFEVHLADNLSSTGEAFITSSAADESALESEEIRGSFFSHHLISGLRGAADASGDGQVTLAEAYQYAFARTVSATANTVIGPQHPGYDYKLSGRGDVVLTRLQRPSALLEAPAGFDRMLLVDRRRAEVVVELGPRAARRVAVAAGRYRLHAWRAGQLFGTDLVVAAGEVRLVPFAALTPASPQIGVSKGPTAKLTATAAEDAPASHQRAATRALLVGAGYEGAVADSLRGLPGLRLGLSGIARRSPTLSLNLASARGQGFRESRVELRAGYQQRWSSARWWLAVGAELGGGAAAQQIDGEHARRSLVGSAGVTSVLGLTLWSPVSLVLAGELPVRLLRRQDQAVALIQPAAWLGFVLAL